MLKIMYLKPFKNFTYWGEQDKLSAVKKSKMKSSKANFVTFRYFLELFAFRQKDNWVFIWTFSFHL